jgi:hypothetical protein
MSANEITFGIEIETHIPVADECHPGGHRCGKQVPWLPAGWLGDADPSIRYPAGHKPCEFVSPILKGADGLRQLVESVAKINEHGAKVNDSCGIHVHVGWAGDDDATARLISLVANFEKAVFAATGTTKRETGRWCNSIHQHGTAQAARTRASFERYHVLNLTNLRQGHVEFRAFSGSTNIVKIVGFIRLCIAMVEKAMNGKKSAKWTAKPTVKTSPVHRSGEGQTQLTRAFYALGWTKGRTPYTYGNLEVDGAPSFIASKKELMRLARKYDAETEARRRVLNPIA